MSDDNKTSPTSVLYRGDGDGTTKTTDPSRHVPKALTTPRCVGLESRLKKLHDLPRMSRQESLDAFVFHTSFGRNEGYGTDNG